MRKFTLLYYITIIMILLENELPIDEIVVMVQKEAGERLCAEVGTRQAGAVSVAVIFMQAVKSFLMCREKVLCQAQRLTAL